MNFIARVFLVLILISNLGYGVSYAAPGDNTVKKPVHKNVKDQADPAQAPAPVKAPPGKAPVTVLPVQNPSVPPAAPRPHPQVPIPPITEERGGVATIKQAITHIWHTVFYDTRFPDYVTTNADVGKVDAQDMEDFIQDASVPNSSKVHENDHYEFRDPRITEKLIKMKTSGFGRVSLHTDPANLFNLGPDDVTTSDFNKLMAQGKLKKNKDGSDDSAVVELKKELAAGFKFVGSDLKLSENQGKPGFQYTISGPSVEKLKPDEEGVIFHLKRYVNFVVKNAVKIYRNARSGEVNYSLPPNVVIDKDNNANPHHRNNTTYEFGDPKIMEDMSSNHETMAKVFGDGGTIAQVPATPLRRLVYDDGTIEVVNIASFVAAHPDQRFNPNSYMIEMLKDAIYTHKIANNILLDPNYDRPPADPTQKTTVEDIQMMAYVFTDRDLLEAITRFYALKTGATGTFVFDQQFADMNAAGFAALFSGVPLNRQMGGILEDADGFLSNNPNIKSYLYQRWVEGSGAPFILHGKFVVFKVTINGKKFVVVHDLSFNISGHDANAENRMIVTSDPNTEFAQDSVDRPGKIIAIEQPQGFVVEGIRGEFRNFLSHLTEIDLKDVDLKDTFAIFDLVNSAQNRSADDISKIYNEFVSRVGDMFKGQAKGKLSRADFDLRMKNINGFFHFLIQDQAGKGSKEISGLTIQKFIAALDNIAYKGEKFDEQRGDLRFALATKKVKDMTKDEIAALDAKVDAATKAEGRSEPLPPMGEKPVFTPKATEKVPEKDPVVAVAETKVETKKEAEKKPEAKPETKKVADKKVETRPTRPMAFASFNAPAESNTSEGRVRKGTAKGALERYHAKMAASAAAKSAALQAPPPSFAEACALKVARLKDQLRALREARRGH
jgi:hypothetical protein